MRADIKTDLEEMKAAVSASQENMETNREIKMATAEHCRETPHVKLSTFLQPPRAEFAMSYVGPLKEESIVTTDERFGDQHLVTHYST
jgi:hypothetical protein